MPKKPPPCAQTKKKKKPHRRCQLREVTIHEQSKQSAPSIQRHKSFEAGQIKTKEGAKKAHDGQKAAREPQVADQEYPKPQSPGEENTALRERAKEGDQGKMLKTHYPQCNSTTLCPILYHNLGPLMMTKVTPVHSGKTISADSHGHPAPQS